MFVKIINPNVNITAIDYYIKNYRNQNEAIPPEFAHSVLEKTNHLGNIKIILKYIQNLPEEEQLKYKDFVISAIEGRNQSPNNFTVLKQLAITGGYQNEFDEANKKEKLYEITDGCGTYVTTPDELVDAIDQRAPNIIARIDCKDSLVVIDHIDFRNVKELKIYNERMLRLPKNNFPEFLNLSQCRSMTDLDDMDFSNVKKISLSKTCGISKIKEFPEEVDVSQCEELRIIESNLSNINFSKMKKLRRIILEKAYNFPESLDFSECIKVDIENCNLEKVKEIILSEKTKEISLCLSENIPENIDVSMCDIVKLADCNLTNIKNLKFKNGSRVRFTSPIKQTILPSDLDVSMCDYVDFQFCDMSGLTNLRFKDGAEVVLGKILPQNLDISNCSSIETHVVHLDLIETTKFKDCKKIKFKGSFPQRYVLDLTAFSIVELLTCHLKYVKNIKFKKGAIVNMAYTELANNNIDFSQCSKVNLSHTDLNHITLNFAKDAEVDLSFCHNFPERLDLSMCKKANLTGAELYKVKQITFKNEAQKTEFFKGCSFFSGEIIYTEHPQQNIIQQKELEL